MKNLAIVVAIGPKGVIGKLSGLPWHVPEDMRHFRNVTMGHAIIMGRKTHESIGKTLPGRRNIVVSRSEDLRVSDGAERASGLAPAIDLARAGGDDEPRVIGGARLYEEALPLATRLFLTEITFPAEGDVYFPSFDRAAWREVERREGTTPGVTFVTLARTS